MPFPPTIPNPIRTNTLCGDQVPTSRLLQEHRPAEVVLQVTESSPLAPKHLSGNTSPFSWGCRVTPKGQSHLARRARLHVTLSSTRHSEMKLTLALVCLELGKLVALSPQHNKRLSETRRVPGTDQKDPHSPWGWKGVASHPPAPTAFQLWAAPSLGPLSGCVG